MGQLYYHSIMRKCTKCRLGANFSLAEPITTLEISEKPSLLTNMLIANTTGTQPLFTIRSHVAFTARTITQPFNTVITHAARVRVANTYDARTATKIMQRMIKNAANGNKYYPNNTSGRLNPISRIPLILLNGRHQQHVHMLVTKRGKVIQSYDYSAIKRTGNWRACPIGSKTML
jgi:hypothetical protein